MDKSRAYKKKYLYMEIALKTASGFRQDCENLLTDYVALHTFNYEPFCNVWKEMNFSLLYCGRKTLAELLEFSDEVLLITKKYLLNTVNDYHFRVGALYLLYGLYFKQPTKGTQKIRMTLSDWEEYENIVSYLRENSILEALYVATKLKVHRAFDFVKTDYAYGLSRNYIKTQINPVKEHGIDTASVTQNINSIYYSQGLLKALENLNKKYYLEKSVLPEARNGKPEPSLDLVDRNLSITCERNLNKLAIDMQNECTINSDSDQEQVFDAANLNASLETVSKKNENLENVGEAKRELKKRGFKRKIKKFRESPTKKSNDNMPGTSK